MQECACALRMMGVDMCSVHADIVCVTCTRYVPCVYGCPYWRSPCEVMAVFILVLEAPSIVTSSHVHVWQACSHDTGIVPLVPHEITTVIS